MFLLILLSSVIGLIALMIALAVALTGQSPVKVIYEILTFKGPNDVPFFVPISFMLFFLTTIAGSVGAAYYLILPEITVKSNANKDSFFNFLLPDEKAIVEVLLKHGGAMLQKDISRETGLTRVKVHRVIARLAERGLVSVERAGNTNMVRLNITTTYGSTEIKK